MICASRARKINYLLKENLLLFTNNKTKLNDCRTQAQCLNQGKLQ